LPETRLLDFRSNLSTARNTRSTISCNAARSSRLLQDLLSGLPIHVSLLERLHKRYGGDGVTFLGISQDDTRDTKEFAKEFGVTFPMLLDDENGYIVSNAYGLSNVPTIFLVDTGGTVKVSSMGFDKKDLETIAAELAQRRNIMLGPLFRPDEVVPINNLDEAPKTSPVGPDNFAVREPQQEFDPGLFAFGFLQVLLVFRGPFPLVGNHARHGRGQPGVPGGAPRFHALVDDSLPFSLHGNLFRGQFPNGPPGLIDGFIRISKRACIGIRNMDATKRLTADFAGRLSRRPLRVVQGIVFVGVAVGPAIDGDGLNVTRRIESAGGRIRAS